ncbi:MAG: peroxiredoxin family protein [Chloroflexi bacterium]|nr:peroxiredoxin family protein [Chloroflexota bacterium]
MQRRIILKDHQGNEVELHQLSGEAGMVLAFMRGTYCPDCVHQLHRSNRYAARLAEFGLSLVWVARDEPTNINTYYLGCAHELRFTLLPDTEPSVARFYGIAEADYLLQPAPVALLLDKTGSVRFVHRRENPQAPLGIDVLLQVAAAQDPLTL